jgi:hypothetical protein
MELQVKQTAPATTLASGTLISNQDAMWAQGTVLATLSRLCPKFAEFEHDLMENEVSYITASLEAAQSQGYSQIGSGAAEGGIGVASAGGGCLGIRLGTGALSEGASLYQDYYRQPVVNNGTVAKEGGKIVEAENALKALDTKGPTATFQEGPSLEEEDTEVELRELASAEDGRAPAAPANREVQKRKLKNLEREYGHHEGQLSRKSNMIQLYSQVAQGAGQFLMEPGKKVLDFNATIKDQTKNITSRGFENQEGQKSATISTYGELVQGVGGLYSANQAISSHA